MLKEHEIIIEQGNSWTKIKLIDKYESHDRTIVNGIWKHTSDSYDGTEIKFTSDNPQYLYFEWFGPHVGPILIGSKMGRASHKAGEETMFQILIQLLYARRMANGNVEITSVLGTGVGLLTYNVNPHFSKGDILWSPTRYEQ